MVAVCIDLRQEAKGKSLCHSVCAVEEPHGKEQTSSVKMSQRQAGTKRAKSEKCIVATSSDVE
jgi:hypothetical protein